MELRTRRTEVTRKRERGRYDEQTVHAILDEAPICHVGFARDGTPFVLPTIHARIGSHLYLHGSTASGMLTTLKDGAAVCVTATIVDGLILARSAMHHSMNYRSVVVIGNATAVSDTGEKLRALRAVVEHVTPGRWDEVRAPSGKELASTLVLRVPIMEASAKIRTGPPIDDDEDYALPIWAGEVPLQMRFLEAVADTEGLDPPPSVRQLLQ
ncbi:MAG: pyridoxamine 5'-phosphate oxidase family protein [Actinomycetota bacterium]